MAKTANPFVAGKVSHLKRIGYSMSDVLVHCVDDLEDKPAGSEKFETLLGEIREFCSIGVVRPS